MNTNQLSNEIMALPLAERVTLAQQLWQSIEPGLPDITEQEALKEAIRRDHELTAGSVTGRTHEEVIQAARRAIE